MLFNYVKIALRSLAKHKFFSMLNILGLALGMSSCLTVILIIRDQLSYDRFHPNAERIFRINCQQPEGTKMATVPYPLGDALTRDFSIAESSVRLVRSLFGVDATTSSNLTLPISGFYTEPSFFKVFGFHLEAGNAATALNEPNTMVLSKKTAERFFGTANAIGQTLALKDKGTYRITGIVADAPGKSHLDFDCLASVSSMIALEAAMKPEEAVERILDNWENRYMSYDYVLLSPGKTQDDLANALTVVEQNRAKLNEVEKGVHFFTQNIEKINPKPENYANDLGGGAPWFFIWGMGVFVLLLTIFPCLNYANMAVSQALARTREIGVRKAIGARNGDVKNLILVEAVTTSLLALGVAWCLHLPLNHFVSTYFPAGAKLENMTAGPVDWVIFIVFGIFVGLLAGWIPARRLAKLDPSKALRGNRSGEAPKKSQLSLRTAMLIGQFSVSLIFMIVVATLWGQMHYMTVADYGFQKENLLTIALQGNKAGVMAAEMAQDPHVTGVCMTSVVVASNNLQGTPLFKERGGEDLGAQSALVDENYLPVMGLNLVAGENFPKNLGDTKDKYLILNEKALERFQLGTPQEAVGKVLWMSDTVPAKVVGVVRNFHNRILEHAIEPFALVYSPTEKGYIMHLRVAPGDPQVTMASLGSIWKKIDNIHPFKATFLEESIQKAYGHVTFVGGLASFFALLSLMLSCMGLLGTVAYSVSTRVKEIGIRKVLGATVAEVTLLLSKRFLLLLGITLLIALPAGYALANLFLNLFVYRISVGALILGSAAGLLLGLGLLTIGVQAVRAAVKNPVESLRSE